MKNKNLILSLLGLAMVSFSCHDDNYRNQQPIYQQPVYQEPIYQQQPQQVVIQERNSAGDLITGMAAGAIINHAINNRNSSSNNRTIVNKTIIRRTTIVNRNSYRPTPSYRNSRPSYSTRNPSAMKNSFGKVFGNKRR